MTMTTMTLPAIDDWGIPSTLLEDMGVLLEGVSANDAILMWPVTILGQKESDGVDLHVTLNWGKWDGSEGELTAAVADALAGERFKLPQFTQWVPALFQGKEKKFLVMQLPEVQKFVVNLRKKLSSVFQDHFGDGYMPHISVSQSLYDHISSNKITPREASVALGGLELRLGDKLIETLSEAMIAEGRYSLPASQKMVLRDMISNSRRWRDWPGGFYVPEDEQRSRDQERLFSTYVLWPVMRSLLAKGLIEQTATRGIKYFKVTQKGEAEMSRG